MTNSSDFLFLGLHGGPTVGVWTGLLFVSKSRGWQVDPKDSGEDDCGPSHDSGTRVPFSPRVSVLGNGWATCGTGRRPQGSTGPCHDGPPFPSRSRPPSETERPVDDPTLWRKGREGEGPVGLLVDLSRSESFTFIYLPPFTCPCDVGI